MEITATWKSDKEYLQTFWKDWIKHRSKMRKWIIHIGIALILLGGILLANNIQTEGLLKSKFLFLVILGAGIIVWHFWEKSKWFGVLRAAPSYGKENILRFTEKGIFYSIPTSKGEMAWEAIGDIVIASQGLFLIVQQGLSIYIPRSAVRSSTEFDLINKLYRESQA